MEKCKYGHPFDEANTHIAKDGSKVCRACRAAAVRKSRTGVDERVQDPDWVPKGSPPRLLTETGRICSSCQEDKPLTEFYKTFVNGRERYRPVCKPCWKDKRNIQRRRRYLAKDPALLSAASRNYYRTRFGLSEDQYWEIYYRLLSDQGGRCAICKSTSPRSASGREERFALDHNHETGAIRGLLCVPCNLGIGHFNDHPETLVEAADYLRRTDGSVRSVPQANHLDPSP